MNNSIDSFIRLALTDLAEDAPAPAVDQAPRAIRRAALRRRTATLLVGVASLVAAVLLGLQLVSAGTHSPQPGAPPSAPAPSVGVTPEPSDNGSSEPASSGATEPSDDASSTE